MKVKRYLVKYGLVSLICLILVIVFIITLIDFNNPAGCEGYSPCSPGLFPLYLIFFILVVVLIKWLYGKVDWYAVSNVKGKGDKKRK